MKKSTLEIYAFAVCFVSLMVLLVSAPICSHELFRVLFPSVTVGDYTYDEVMSDEDYLKSIPQGQPRPEASEVPLIRKALRENALRHERHAGMKLFLQSLTYTLTAGVVFWLHWRVGRRERLNAVAFNA